MSDGFPEIVLENGEPFGYESARAAFAEIAGLPVDQVVGCLTETVKLTAGGTPDDDVTLVVVRRRALSD